METHTQPKPYVPTVPTCSWRWLWRGRLRGPLHENIVEEPPSLVQRGAWHREHLGAVLHRGNMVCVCADGLNIPIILTRQSNVCMDKTLRLIAQYNI